MSPVAIIIVIFGALIALTRGPLVVAPLEVRDYYLRLFNTDARMRLIGISIALLGAGSVWAARGETGVPADAVFAFGLFLLVLMVVFFIPFATAARLLATSIWSAFGETTLRVLGALSVTAGLALIYYGFSI